MPTTRKRTLPALAAVAALCAAAGTAGPADAKPEPCNGIFMVDPADDGTYSPGGSADFEGLLSGPAPENLEVLNTFVNSAGGKVTMNITIKNLTREVPDGIAATGGNYYYGYFLWQDRVRFVRAANSGSGDIAYGYGYVTSGTHGDDDVPGVYQTEGDTTGTFDEGPNGVVSIEIPAAIGGKTGETLGALGGSAETIEGQDDFVGINHQTDTAPDEYSITSPEGAGYTVADCPAGAGGGGATPPPTGGGGTTPPPSGGGGGSTPPPSGGGGGTSTPAPGTTALPLKAARTLGSAKKAKKKKSLTFKVTAGKPITNLKLVLRPAKGGKPVGTATVKSLKAGSSKVKLKVTKKLKAGRYALAANGFVDGQQQGTTQAVKVKK